MNDDLISRSELRARFQAILDRGDMFCEYDIIGMVDNAPTVERPRGEWIYIGQRNRLKVVECTNCHKRQYGSMKYCGNCGADMRGEKE